MEASLIQVQKHAGLGCSARNLCQPHGRVQQAYVHFPVRKIQSSMHLEWRNLGSLSLKASSVPSYSEEKPDLPIDEPPKSIFEPSKEGTSVHQKKAAKIHDFCLGIPFGGFILCTGFLGYIFSQNLATLSTGLLFGGALLSLSCFSLKVWKHGLSSLPFIVGQGAIAAMLFWKHFRVYSLTKELFPAGFVALLSGAMFCFYSYVLISGGNPPPKKLAAKTT